MPTIVDNSTKRESKSRLRSRNGTPVYEETLHYLVKADYVQQPRLEILQTPGLPRINEIIGGYAAVRSVDATRRPDSALYYDVAIEISSEVEENQGEDGDNPTSDPTAWTPVYETKFERIEEIVTEDQAGNKIANSAGQAFEEGLTIARFIPVWEFFQFEAATISDEQIIDRNETVNNAAFKGRPAKSLLCTVMSSTIGFFYGQRRRLTQYSLKYNEKLWTHKRLDVGTQYLDGSDLLDYLSDSDPPSIMLGALDGAGAKQAAGTEPATLSFDIYPSISFGFIRG